MNSNGAHTRVAANDPSLARGLAKNLLREIEKECDQAMDSVMEAFYHKRANEPMNAKRHAKVITELQQALHGVALGYHRYGQRMTERVMTTYAIDQWDFVLGSKDEGIMLMSLVLWAKRREFLDMRPIPFAMVGSHVLARLFQRDRLYTRLELMGVLRGLRNRICLIAYLAAWLGHRQWGVPVGPDAMIIGPADFTTDPALTAATYIKPLGPRWGRYHAAMSQVLAAAEAKGEGWLPPTYSERLLDLSRSAEGINDVVRPLEAPCFAWAKQVHVTIDE